MCHPNLTILSLYTKYILISRHTNASWADLANITSTLMMKPFLLLTDYANMVNLFQNCYILQTPILAHFYKVHNIQNCSILQTPNLASFNRAHNTMNCRHMFSAYLENCNLPQT